ncbi:hypothetical protein [Polymorphospora rubra]|uniref:Uncharacterized protein n=1 Tax=Polymorphospora rubra TaxID=338584 RepID=A0A810N3J8_9ACTN|nr:hypothetical protein [Polymorphospora rubra]BCJ68042.1 hypothetical protein Prubr_50630 [Polymorphospora rubra]
MTSVEREKLARLRRENRRVRKDVDILKRGHGFLREGDPVNACPRLTDRIVTVLLEQHEHYEAHSSRMTRHLAGPRCGRRPPHDLRLSSQTIDDQRGGRPHAHATPNRRAK